MDERITVSDEVLDIEGYCEDNHINLEKFSSCDFLALPNKYSDNEYYFAEETIDFIKFCCNETTEYKSDVLTDGDISVRSLHSFDIWLPVIKVAEYALIPIVVGLITNYIYDKLKGREKDDAKVEFSICVTKGKKKTSIHYKGDAKTVKDSFDKIDITKL